MLLLFTKILFLLKLPIPEKKLKGTLITKAQGQEIKSKVALLCNASLKLTLKKGDNKTTKIDISTTIGVYTLENLDINFSLFDFLSVDSSNNFIILLTVESSYIFDAFIFNTPVKLILPLITSLLSSTSTLKLSPVKLEVSTSELPLKTTPSTGIFSPPLTRIMSPTLTSLRSLFINSSLTKTLA